MSFAHYFGNGISMILASLLSTFWAPFNVSATLFVLGILFLFVSFIILGIKGAYDEA